MSTLRYARLLNSLPLFPRPLSPSSSLSFPLFFFSLEYLFYQYGSGLTHDNQLTGEGDGSEVTEVVKKALDERITRQHQIREQVRIPTSMRMSTCTCTMPVVCIGMHACYYEN